MKYHIYLYAYLCFVFQIQSCFIYEEDISAYVSDSDTLKLMEYMDKNELTSYNDVYIGKYTVLEYCIFNSNSDTCNRLIRNGADPNVMHGDSSNTPLMKAIRPKGNQFRWFYDTSMVAMLVENGADVNHVLYSDSSDEHMHANSPLKIAVQGELNNVKILLSNGADPNQLVGRERPLGTAVRFGKMSTARYLIESGNADPMLPLRISPVDTLFLCDYLNITSSWGHDSVRDFEYLMEASSCIR